MSGTIELHEFQSLWNYIQQWKGVFEQFDQNRSGAIDFNELCNGEYIFLLVSSCCLVGFTCLFESCIGSTHFKGLSLKKKICSLSILFATLKSNTVDLGVYCISITMSIPIISVGKENINTLVSF